MEIVEKELREAYEEIKTLVHTIPDIIYRINEKGIFTFVNDAVTDLGYRPEELVGKHFSEIIHPDDLQRVGRSDVLPKYRGKKTGDAGAPKLFDERRTRKRKTRHLEVRIVSKKGDERIGSLELVGEVSASGQYDRNVKKKDKKFLGTVGVIRDITERKKAEEALRESQAFNSALFEHNPIETIVVDQDGRVTRFNLAKKRSGDRLPNIGDVMYLDYAGKHEADMHAELMKCIRSGKTRRFPERKYGDKFLAITISPFSHGAILISRDITERKRAEEQLKRSTVRLRDLSRHLRAVREEEKTRIARRIHDDLGQGLTALKIDMSSLVKKFPREQKSAREKEKGMLKLLGSMVKIVQGVSSELKPPILEHLGLGPAIQWASKEFQNRAGIKVETDVDEEIAVDKERSIALFRICQELFTNIARHAEAKRVNVRLQQKPGEPVALEVKDNGRGIKEEEIFSPRSFGLTEIQECALSWGGDVKIEGIQDKGTTVMVTIPVNDGDEMGNGIT